MFSRAVVLFLIFLCGCASNPRIEDLSPAERHRASAMKVFKGEADRPFALLGTVDGLSCHRNAYSKNDISEEEAMDGIKIKAALLRADAVVNVICQKNSGTDWGNNCFGSVKCIGDAVRFRE